VIYSASGKNRAKSRAEIGVFEKPQVPNKTANTVRLSFFTLRDAARLAHVTRARMTQIMNLTQLAADIQEAVLFLAPVLKGRDPVTERDLRPIAAEYNWTKQRELWTRLIGSEQSVTH